MLKKMLKGCLAIAAVCAMSTSAFAAEATINGFLWTSFGQYNSGVEDTDAYFINSNFAPLGVNVKGEKLDVYAEIDWMRTSYTSGGAVPAAGEDKSGIGPSHIVYHITDEFSLKVGHNDPAECKPFARGSGTIQPQLPAYWGSDNYTHVFDYGIHGRYAIPDTATINFGLLSEDTVGSQTGGGPSQSGQGFHVSAGGAAGAIHWRAAYITGATNDHQDSSDDASNSSAMMVSGQFDIGDTMFVNAGYSTKSIDHSAGDVDPETGNIIDLQFGLKQAGPGSLTITYAMEATNNDMVPDEPIYGALAGAQIEKFEEHNTWMSLVYAYPLAPGENLYGMYLSKTNDWGYDGESIDGVDPVTATFLGIGFAKFF